jgi:hypothetical protein
MSIFELFEFPVPKKNDVRRRSKAAAGGRRRRRKEISGIAKREKERIVVKPVHLAWPKNGRSPLAANSPSPSLSISPAALIQVFLLKRSPWERAEKKALWSVKIREKKEKRERGRERRERGRC